MTEDEKQAIRKSFAGKGVSQMTTLERHVFDEDFQYGVGSQHQNNNLDATNSVKRIKISSIMKRLGLRK